MAHPRVLMMLVPGLLVLAATPAASGVWVQDQPRKEGQDRPDRLKDREERRPERVEHQQDRPADRRPDREERRTEHPVLPSRSNERTDRPHREQAPRDQPQHIDTPQRGQRLDRPTERRHDDRPLTYGTRPPVHKDDPGSTSLSSYPTQPRTHELAREWERQHSWRPPGAWGEHGSWGEHRAHQWQTEHRPWGERGGYGGYFIPEAQFRLHYGGYHGFRIHSRPSIYQGYPRFRHGGYWFMLVDPWPEFWSETWYETDDVYIDYSDGYYLYNRRHPGVALALSISF